MFLSIISNEAGYAMELQRIIIEDFNGDGIDDIFHSKCLSRTLNNGKFSYERN